MRPLRHPKVEDLRPDAILHALSDPWRAAVARRVWEAGPVEAGVALGKTGGRPVPKSSLSRHMTILREAGLISCERHGVRMHIRSRRTEVDDRFPGLLAAVFDAYS